MPFDLGFLLGFALGCICTAALCWWAWKQPRRRWQVQHGWGDVQTIATSWRPHPLTRHLGAAAQGEVADLAVSAGALISTVRSLRSQIDRAHATLKDATR